MGSPTKALCSQERRLEPQQTGMMLRRVKQAGSIFSFGKTAGQRPAFALEKHKSHWFLCKRLTLLGILWADRWVPWNPLAVICASSTRLLHMGHNWVLWYLEARTSSDARVASFPAWPPSNWLTLFGSNTYLAHFLLIYSNSVLICFFKEIWAISKHSYLNKT